MTRDDLMPQRSQPIIKFLLLVADRLRFAGFIRGKRYDLCSLSAASHRQRHCDCYDNCFHDSLAYFLNCPELTPIAGIDH